ncbi:10401_t:CDS:2, partial [Racocetra persica]
FGKPFAETFGDYLPPDFEHPIFNVDGSFLAMMNMSEDTTTKVLASRRLKCLGDLGN